MTAAVDAGPERWVRHPADVARLLAALAGVVPAIMAYRTSVARNLKPIG
jgi:hypothetical protein